MLREWDVMSSPGPGVPMRQRRWIRRILWSLCGVGALFALGVVGVIAAIRLPLPNRSGRVRLPALSSGATVIFDARGVPHVRASTEDDAYRVLGWLHAGDRFFQMELRRRAAAGRLAEILGPSLLAFDLESRRAGHEPAAARDLETLSARARAAVDAYAQGVNAYLATHPRPIEMIVLGIEPEPWSAIDSLAFSRFMLAGLSEAPERKIRALVAHGILGSADGTSVLPGADASSGVASGRGGPAGSNAWALSGTRTSSGRPVLANDPHLGVEFPGVWYAAHLTTRDGLDVAGLTLAGVPGVAIGHNDRAAWGITMAQVDDADPYLETIDPPHRAYLREDRWVPLASREEKIRVKGQASRDVVFYATDQGTLLGGFPDRDGTWKAVALAFATDRVRGGPEAFLIASRARAGADFEMAWASYGGPAFNVCWATADDHIGMRLAGSVPARRSMDLDDRGMATRDWAGVVRDAELPRMVDPPEGLVASANDDWSVAGPRLPFPGFYASNDRVGRIRELLSGTRAATAADMNQVQNDVLSPYARRIVKELSGLAHPDGGAGRALDILEGWDARASRTGPARLFYTFLSELASRRGIAGWDAVEEAATQAVETHDEVIAASLAASLETVEREDGTEPASWNWGRVHTLRYEHPFSSHLPSPFRFLRRWLDVGPLEMPGEIHTVHVEGFSLGREPRIRHIPSARLVVDLGNLDASTLVLPLGQSGQFQDAHYDDQVGAWAGGRTFPFPFTTKAVDGSAVSELRLEP